MMEGWVWIELGHTLLPYIELKPSRSHSCHSPSCCSLVCGVFLARTVGQNNKKSKRYQRLIELEYIRCVHGMRYVVNGATQRAQRSSMQHTSHAAPCSVASYLGTLQSALSITHGWARSACCCGSVANKQDSQIAQKYPECTTHCYYHRLNYVTITYSKIDFFQCRRVEYIAPALRS